MGTRWMKDTWVDALSRLERWAGDVAVCWAEAPDRSGAWKILGVTVRGDTRVPDVEYRYEHLQLRSRLQPAADTARMLREGRVLKAMGDREYRDIQATEGQAYWLTSGAVFGMTGPFSTPSYYFSVYVSDQDLVAQAQLSLPVFGSDQPYYPTGEDALLDVLYGATRDQGRHELVNSIVIHLPYTDAFIRNATYIEGEGMVISVGEAVAGTARGHGMQAIWKIQASERSYQREARTLAAAGDVTLPLDVEPIYFAASLQDQYGLLVDSVERRRRIEIQSEGFTLPAEAIPEAFDFLASVWRNVTGHHLFEVRRVSPATELGAQAATRGDFSSRISAFADVLKAIRVDDSLIDTESAKRLAQESSLGRLKLAVQKLLVSPDLDTATSALSVLQDIVRVRVALQHQHAKPDLPTALASLGINYPVEWDEAWEQIRHRAVEALRDLRSAIESGST